MCCKILASGTGGAAGIAVIVWASDLLVDLAPRWNNTAPGDAEAEGWAEASRQFCQGHILLVPDGHMPGASALGYEG